MQIKKEISKYVRDHVCLNKYLTICSLDFDHLDKYSLTNEANSRTVYFILFYFLKKQCTLLIVLL